MVDWAQNTNHTQQIQKQTPKPLPRQFRSSCPRCWASWLVSWCLSTVNHYELFDGCRSWKKKSPSRTIHLVKTENRNWLLTQNIFANSKPILKTRREKIVTDVWYHKKNPWNCQPVFSIEEWTTPSPEAAHYSTTVFRRPTFPLPIRIRPTFRRSWLDSTSTLH